VFCRVIIDSTSPNPTPPDFANRIIYIFTSIDRLQIQYAEHSGYWEETTFLDELDDSDEYNNNPVMTFYDSNTGRPLFRAPIGRTWHDFLRESRRHGWPSFRDDEVNWDYVRVLEDGETVSVDGTHLGHNLPDRSGRRYCINLVSIAGNPVGGGGGAAGESGDDNRHGGGELR